MAGHECYHCKQWIEEGEAHDCWTTTEQALTAELSEDLREAWERLRDTAADFGEQRIYAAHNSIMFSRKSCYFYVRPKKSFLEVCLFLGRAVKSPHVRRSDRSSKSKFLNIIQLKHRDQVEAPITDWLREAYELLCGACREGRESHARKEDGRKKEDGARAHGCKENREKERPEKEWRRPPVALARCELDDALGRVVILVADARPDRGVVAIAESSRSPLSPGRRLSSPPRLRRSAHAASLRRDRRRGSASAARRLVK